MGGAPAKLRRIYANSRHIHDAIPPARFSAIARGVLAGILSARNQTGRSHDFLDIRRWLNNSDLGSDALALAAPDETNRDAVVL